MHSQRVPGVMKKYASHLPVLSGIAPDPLSESDEISLKSICFIGVLIVPCLMITRVWKGASTNFPFNEESKSEQYKIPLHQLIKDFK